MRWPRSSSHSQVSFDAESSKAAPKRLEISGHFVHFDDGNFKKRGGYWSTPGDILKTSEIIKTSLKSKKYEHLLIYAHGGLNDPAAAVIFQQEGSGGFGFDKL